MWQNFYKSVNEAFNFLDLILVKLVYELLLLIRTTSYYYEVNFK